ncbi:LLM class flavin-dependent oxidoreductase [Aeromicrobium sp. UC242_57]|uniref:LLM class flavin-dependent oxidoreductase n=1 Tax=Aeromicrobium sp. UC242_57 TaxID=3374624 RepID=UPI003795BA8E
MADVLELVRSAEEWGYHGYWFGEHHLGRGRAGASPVVLTALAAAATQRLHVGTAVAVLPHYRPLALVEQIGTIAELYPDRVHLGLGKGTSHPDGPAPARIAAVSEALADPSSAVPKLEIGDFALLLKELAVSSDSSVDGYERSVRQVLSLLTRPVATIDGHPLQAAPGLGAPVTPWLFGLTSVRSAQHSAAAGLPYVVNQHVSGHSVDEAVAAYREGSGRRCSWTGPISPTPCTPSRLLRRPRPNDSPRRIPDG